MNPLAPQNFSAVVVLRRGVTLVEMLVATALSTSILLGVFALFGGSLELFNRTRHAVESASEGRFALGRIEFDLTGMFVEKGGGQFVENLPGLFVGAPGYGPQKKNESVFMVTQSLNPGGGDLCVVAYRLNRETLSLERAFLDSESSWSSSPRFMAEAYMDLEWEAMAENVVAFEVHCYNSSEAALEAIPPTPSTTSWDSEDDGRPALVAVQISFADPEIAARIREEGGLDDSDVTPTNPSRYTQTIALQ